MGMAGLTARSGLLPPLVLLCTSTEDHITEGLRHLCIAVEHMVTETRWGREIPERPARVRNLGQMELQLLQLPAWWNVCVG